MDAAAHQHGTVGAERRARALLPTSGPSHPRQVIARRCHRMRHRSISDFHERRRDGAQVVRTAAVACRGSTEQTQRQRHVQSMWLDDNGRCEARVADWKPRNKKPGICGARDRSRDRQPSRDREPLHVGDDGQARGLGRRGEEVARVAVRAEWCGAARHGGMRGAPKAQLL